MAVPGHGREREHHDVYVEVLGPSTVDAHHNFVRRWNEVSERIACNGRWGSGSEDDRAFPTRLPKPCGLRAANGVDRPIARVARTLSRSPYFRFSLSFGVPDFSIVR